MVLARAATRAAVYCRILRSPQGGLPRHRRAHVRGGLRRRRHNWMAPAPPPSAQPVGRAAQFREMPAPQRVPAGGPARPRSFPWPTRRPSPRAAAAAAAAPPPPDSTPLVGPAASGALVAASGRPSYRRRLRANTRSDDGATFAALRATRAGGGAGVRSRRPRGGSAVRRPAPVIGAAPANTKHGSDIHTVCAAGRRLRAPEQKEEQPLRRRT